MSMGARSWGRSGLDSRGSDLVYDSLVGCVGVLGLRDRFVCHLAWSMTDWIILVLCSYCLRGFDSRGACEQKGVVAGVLGDMYDDFLIMTITITMFLQRHSELVIIPQPPDICDINAMSSVCKRTVIWTKRY